MHIERSTPEINYVISEMHALKPRFHFKKPWFFISLQPALCDLTHFDVTSQ